MYYPYSENKGADQLRGYREADLRLCFRICKKPVFSRRGSYCLHENKATDSNSKQHRKPPLKIPTDLISVTGNKRQKFWGLKYHKYTAIFCWKNVRIFCNFSNKKYCKRFSHFFNKNNSVFDNEVGIYVLNELTS